MMRGMHVKACIALAACLAGTMYGQWKEKDTEWAYYTADLAGTKYRPLDQINASNFNKLEVAWRFKTDNFGTRPEYKLEGTPLMVKGVLYATAGTRRSVVALDAKTGEVIWVLQPARRQTRGDRSAPAFRPRRVVLDRRQGRRPHRVRHHRLPPGRAECEDRPADRRLRQGRHGRSEGRHGHRHRPADRSGNRRGRPALDAARW